MTLRLRVSRRYLLATYCNTSPGLISLLKSAAGLPCDRTELQLDIFTKYGDTTSLRFFFDLGADLMVIPLYVARHEGIAYGMTHPGILASSVGGRVNCFYDFVTVRSSLSGKTHRWPCAFADSITAPLVVGRAAFLEEFAIFVNGSHLVVSYPASPTQFLTHWLARLRSGFTTTARSEKEWQSI